MKIIINYFIYLFLILFMYSDVPNNDSIKSYNIINQENYDYNFILNIPDINLSVKVYDYDDERNNVDKGIYLVKDYDFQGKNSLILASHSGSSSISYFKNLNQLKENCLFFIEKDLFNYYYIVTKIYFIEKNGTFKYKNEKDTVYLITCDKNNRKKQLVIKGKILKIVKKSNF